MVCQTILALGGCLPSGAAFGQAVVERPPAQPAAAHVDPIRQLQAAAEEVGTAAWGYWGDQPGRYVSWSNHSNRLIPVYAFGVPKTPIGGVHSIYRDA